MTDDIKSLIEAQGTALTELRAKLDAKADAVVTDEIKKLNDVLDGISDQMKALQKKAARPGAGADSLTERQDAEIKAFNHYAATGDESELKALQIGVNADGGFALPLIIDMAINKRLVEMSPVRQVAQVVTVSSSNYRKLADVNGTGSGWVGETAARPETGTPQLASIVPTFGTLYANPYATPDSLAETSFDMQAWLTASVQEEFARAEGQAFVSGNGTTRPTGFLAAPVATTADSARAWGTLQVVPSGAASTLPTSLDTFITLVHQLKAGYRAGAVFIMNKTVLGSLRAYKDTTGQYLWQPSVQAGVPSTFMGYPVIEAEDMPNVAANALPIAFGNFGVGYLIADVAGTTVLRDPFSNKPYIGFYTTKKVGGIVQNSEAIKLLRISAS